MIKLDDGHGGTGGAGKVLGELRRTLGPEFVRGVLKAAEIVRGQIVLSIRARLNKDPRGQLQQSYKPVVHDQGVGDVSVGVYSNLPYAGIHEGGGTIVPRTVRNLAIPVKGFLGRSQQGTWPRHLPRGSLKFIPGRGGKSSRLADKASGKLAFILRKSVTIPARHYLTAAADASAPKLGEDIREKLDLAVTKAGAK